MLLGEFAESLDRDLGVLMKAEDVLQRDDAPREGSRPPLVELGEELEAAAADGRPLAWVSVRRWDTKAGGDAVFELELRVWPGAARVAARVDPHGNGIDWRL